MSRAVAQAGPASSIGVLGSPALQQVGIFDATLARYGASAIYPSDQPALLAAIRAIKESGPSATAVRVLSAAAADVTARGAQVQLVACTEFSLIAHAAAEKADILDTMDVLVEAMIGFAFNSPMIPD